jgi:Uncharacterized conserved protein
MPSKYITYGRMSVEDASEELLKLVMFGKIRYPIIAAADARTLRDVILKKLLDRATYINMDVELRVGSQTAIFPNGTELRWFDSTYADRIRGFNYDLAWLHDIGVWNHPSDFYQMIMLGLRLGDSPRILESIGD